MVWFKPQRACLASMKPRVQTPVPPKERKKERKFPEKKSSNE
jgi:hypothetical protein